MGISFLPPSWLDVLSSLIPISQIATMPGGGLTAPKKLSPELADIVGKKEASRAELMKLLWAHIKKNNLQDPDNKQYFIPDKKMAKVFGSEKMRGFGMAKSIGPHLSREWANGLACALYK